MFLVQTISFILFLSRISLAAPFANEKPCLSKSDGAGPSAVPRSAALQARQADITLTLIPATPGAETSAAVIATASPSDSASIGGFPIPTSTLLPPTSPVVGSIASTTFSPSATALPDGAAANTVTVTIALTTITVTASTTSLLPLSSTLGGDSVIASLSALPSSSADVDNGVPSIISTIPTGTASLSDSISSSFPSVTPIPSSTPILSPNPFSTVIAISGTASAFTASVIASASPTVPSVVEGFSSISSSAFVAGVPSFTPAASVPLSSFISEPAVIASSTPLVEPVATDAPFDSSIAAVPPASTSEVINPNLPTDAAAVASQLTALLPRATGAV